jgi:hypothetical protein
MFSVYEPLTAQIAVSTCGVVFPVFDEPPHAATRSETIPRNASKTGGETRLLPAFAREKEVEAMLNLPTSERWIISMIRQVIW